MVLGTNFWPITAQQTEYQIPREMRPTLDRFTRFYSDAHSYVPFPCTPYQATFLSYLKLNSDQQDHADVIAAVN